MFDVAHVHNVADEMTKKRFRGTGHCTLHFRFQFRESLKANFDASWL